MSNTDNTRQRPTRFWSVEVITTHGPKWILAKAQHQGAALQRGSKLGNFLRHSQCHELSEAEYNKAKALLDAQPRRASAKMFENRRSA